VFVPGKRGVYGERPGKTWEREKISSSKKKRKEGLNGTMLFMGSLNAEGFEGWYLIFVTRF
jgi:hypothetical protein